MNVRNGRRSALAMGALLLAMAATGVDARPRDEGFRAAALDGRELRRIAILPVVAVDGNEKAEVRVELSWVRLYRDSKIRWMPADDVRACIAAAPPECRALGEAVERQIWRCGSVEEKTAVELARHLAVDAVLSLRIDRWEVADGGRGTVELTAVLTGADGLRLWSMRGLAGFGTGRTSAEGNFTSDLCAFWNPQLEPLEGRRRIGMALYRLLCRWAPSLPAPMFQDGTEPPPMAVVLDE